MLIAVLHTILGLNMFPTELQQFQSITFVATLKDKLIIIVPKI